MESEKCMKCGRELPGGQVFCEGCLAEMDKYPVKPGVVVMLPRRRTAQPKVPAPRRRSAPTPEEQVVKLKKWVRIQRLCLLLLALLLAAAMWLQINYQLKMEEHKLLPGQNYSSESSQETEKTEK